MRKNLILISCILIMMILSISCDNATTTDNQTTTVTTIDDTSNDTTIQETSNTSDTLQEFTMSIPEFETSLKTTANQDEITPYNLIDHYQDDIIPDFLKNIDWNEDMVVNSEDELIEYLEEQCSQFKTTIPFILSGSCDSIDEDLLVSNQRGIPRAHLQQQSLSHGDVKGIYCVYHVTYYPSAYVVYAYQTGDTSYLEGENLTLYNKAVDFIDNTLDKNVSDIEKEKQIHDYICDITSYYTDDNQDYTDDFTPRFRTAIGCMIDGQANCMGYTDTFYMLATMAGFEVEKANGDEAMKHTWNVITLNGKKYVVDVTWNDDALAHDGQSINNYVYFNAGLDVLAEKYRYDPSVETVMQDVVQTSDENYFFAMNNSTFGYITDDREEFYTKAKELVENGQNTFYIACKTNVAGDTNDMAKQLFDYLQKQGTFSGILQNLSGYSFAYINCSLD